MRGRKEAGREEEGHGQVGRRRTERREANREGGVEIVAEVVEIIEQKRGTIKVQIQKALGLACKDYPHAI